jgi:hypothetical protein
VSVRGNLVRRYWKGIGAFLDAQVTVEENIIEHIATWGMTLWDAGKGRPSGNFQRNVIYDTGACGISIVRGSDLPPNPGRFVRNVVVRTGQDPRYDSGEPYCYQQPVARHAVNEQFAIGGNVFYDNRLPGDAPYEGDLDEAAFQTRMKSVTSRLLRWPALARSNFWRDHVASAPGE